MEEFLKSIGIKEPSVESEDGRVIDIPDSDTFGKYYSILDRCEELDEDDESSQITLDASSIQYVNDDYTVTLLANFTDDTYKLTIREN